LVAGGAEVKFLIAWDALLVSGVEIEVGCGACLAITGACLAFTVGGKY